MKKKEKSEKFGHLFLSNDHGFTQNQSTLYIKHMDQNLKFKTDSGIILLWSSLSFAPCYMMTKQEEGGGGWLMNVDKSGGILR